MTGQWFHIENFTFSLATRLCVNSTQISIGLLSNFLYLFKSEESDLVHFNFISFFFSFSLLFCYCEKKIKILLRNQHTGTCILTSQSILNEPPPLTTVWLIASFIAALCIVKCFPCEHQYASVPSPPQSRNFTILLSVAWDTSCVRIAFRTTP